MHYFLENQPNESARQADQVRRQPEITNALEDLINPLSLKEVLEVGCGAGHLLSSLKFRPPKPHTIGIDISDRLIAQAISHATIDELHVADGSSLPLQNDSVGAAFAVYVLECAENPLAIVRDMYRVIRPGGILILVDGDYDMSFEFPSNPTVKTCEQAVIEIYDHLGVRRRFGRHLQGIIRQIGLPYQVITVSKTLGHHAEDELHRHVQSRLALFAHFMHTYQPIDWQKRLNEYNTALSAMTSNADYLLVMACPVFYARKPGIL